MESTSEADFARYASMLIDLGSATVRNLFDGLVLKNYSVKPAEMDRLFRRPDVLSKMQNKKHLFVHEVYQNITITWFTSRQYDLTDLILLISVLELVQEPSTNWRCQPLKGDTSAGAQLVRLRKLRNDMYAHLTSTSALSERSYNSLASILLSLGAEKKDVDNYETKFKIHDVRKNICDQMKKDMEEIRLLHNALEKSGAKQDENFRRVLEELKKIDQNSISYSVKVLEALQHAPFEEKLSTLIKDTARIQEYLNATTVVKPVVDRQTQPCLKTIGDVLSETQSVFRILVKTSVKQVEEDKFYQSSIDDLAKACGLCDWNVVIDLEYETESTMEFRLALIKSMGCEPKVITYENLENAKDYFPHVASSKMSLWILANGGQDTPPCLTNFARTEQKIRDLLHGIIRTMEKKPVQSFLLAMSDASEEEIDAVTDVANGIKSALDSWEENITANDSYQFCVIFEDVAAKWLDGAIKDIPLYSITKNRKRPEPLKAQAPISQISAMFMSAFPSKNHDESYYIPGSAGECTVSLRELNIFSMDMTIYHREIGVLSDESQNEQIKSSFAKGVSITPEGLRLQETDASVYVDRKEMKDWIKKIEAHLEKRKLRDYAIKTNSIYLLRHPPSAGGSTCARHFLFKLRQKFPCIHVRSYSENLLPNLVQIFVRTKLPLFLVVEMIDFENRPAVRTLQEQLREKWVRFFILLVEQHTGNYVISDRENVFQLSATVCKEDIGKYEKIYKAREIWNGCGGRSNFQFGILSSMGEYSRIKKHVTDCTSENSTSDSQLRIVRALCFLSKYAPKRLVKRSLILKYFETREDHDEEALRNQLGDLNDFVVEEVDKDGFFVCKITVHCLIDPLLARCRERLLSDQAERTQMVEFLDDLRRIVNLDHSVDKSDTSELVRGIFIDRNQYEEQDSLSDNGETPQMHEKQHFSRFLLDLEKECGPVKVSELISSFADLFPSTGSGAHLRGLRARYLMFELKREEDAIKEIKRAIGLQAQSIKDNHVISDAHLLVLYGQLIMKKASSKFDSSNTEIKERVREFQVAVEDAVEAFSRAQKLKVPRPGYPQGQFNSYSFIEEAKSRYSLLDKHLRYLHGSDPRELYKSLAKNRSNTFLCKSYYDAMQAMQKLDYYCEASLVYDHDGKDTESRINRIKWNLQKLIIDQNKALSVFEREISVKQPFDIGWYVSGQSNQKMQKTRFVDLRLSDLKSIHSWIDKRIREGGAILRNNYRDYIMSMICIRRHEPSLTNFNTASAIECANRWIKDFSWDYEAYFMRGALTLVQAIDEDNGKDMELYSAAIEDFEKAKKVVVDDHIKVKWSRQFEIGVGNGLERLIPAELQESSTQRQEFNGCIVGKKEVSVFSSGGSHAFKAHLPNHDEIALSYARPQVKFHLVLRFAGILAQDLKL